MAIPYGYDSLLLSKKRGVVKLYLRDKRRRIFRLEDSAAMYNIPQCIMKFFMNNVDFIQPVYESFRHKIGYTSGLKIKAKGVGIRKCGSDDDHTINYQSRMSR
ncbi:hypothetical protein CSA56_14485 [candidate division KSB3 bacterium]|uniref:Uncharacterized protein n=1 Tax=candidate division KSB3 bacterium TaxID=2044937 RepID=A0A2G6KCK4_9BACT|nr:MAG: hypothetical protein CSA56_14485 [candidate division KSB3 bacterium]